VSRARLFLRALRLRCPACGGGPVLLSWFRLAPSCPSCGLRFERGEDGYWVGSYMFNIVASELLFAAAGAAVVFATWPTPPWTALTLGGAALMVLAPFLFLPFSKVLFLAFDLLFRPPVEADYAAPPEPAAGKRA
jgi:uncharacterized protein (DUF983 family)